MHDQIDSISRRVSRPIHYLGSKLRVIDAIRDLLNQVEPKGRTACDLFAGSGTVSAAVAFERTVIAVDIQEYSRVLCSALLKPAHMSSEQALDFQTRAANGAFRQELRWAAKRLLSYEAYSLEEAKFGQATPICDLIEGGSLVHYQTGTELRRHPKLSRALSETCSRLTRLGLSKGPRAVVLRHFGGIYFSYAQAIDLAALIEMAAKERGRIGNTLTAAVLSTASEIVNTVGKHFAQPLKPCDPNGQPKIHLVRKIIADREADTFSVFSRWLARYCSIPEPGRNHRIIRADYAKALEHHCHDAGVIYADPPYTRDHYSRFYHVLETMCLRDDPEIARSCRLNVRVTGRGAYRLDRHQSPFCIKSQAPEAFERLFSGVRKLEVPLVLSYSPPPNSEKPRARVMSTNDIRKLAQKFFSKVDLIPVPNIRHNKLNHASLNSNTPSNAEVFLVCI
jgi:adenine-specific DNA-methyltransferase